MYTVCPKKIHIDETRKKGFSQREIIKNLNGFLSMYDFTVISFDF